MPKTYWGDALLTTTFVLNCVPSKSVTTTPFELWTKRKPDLSSIRPWRCAAYVHNSSHIYGKLGPRGKKSIFIRYYEQSKGYVFIGEKKGGNIIEFESRDVTFLYNNFPRQRQIGEDLLLHETNDQIVFAAQELDPFSSSVSVLGNGELVSKITQTHPGVDPTMLAGLSGSNNEINESLLRQTNRQPIPCL